jgi:hypothetical protein
MPLEEADAEENTGNDIEIDETVEDDDDAIPPSSPTRKKATRTFTDIIGDVGDDKEKET